MNRWIPFRWLPISWGLKGDAYKRAKATYVYDGMALKRALLDIDYEAGTDEYELAKLKLDHDEKLITDDAYEKACANIRKEPWVGGDIAHADDGGVMFNLDWNEYWIEELRINGYTGDDDDAVMKRWFAALCYSEIMREHEAALDPFFYESARASLNRLMNRDD